MAMSPTDKPATEREEIERILPWYIAGTLAPAEHELVEDYLRRHPQMAVQLELSQQEMAATIGSNERLGAPSLNSLDRLMTAIELEKSAGGKLQDAGRSFLMGWDAFIQGLAPSTMRLAAATAAILIVAQTIALGFVYLRSAPAPAGYQTASGPQRGIPAAGTFALVRFSEKATVAEIGNLLASMDAVIVDGPKPGGTFKLRLSDKVLSSADLARALGVLRANTLIVTFALPAQ
jgi:hypothetical protein